MATILIVDDDATLTAGVARTLSAAGHECIVKVDGEEALSVLHEQSVDLVILDIMIPRISGFELCRRIHNDTSLYGLPVLFLSAMNGEEEVAHGLAQGADDYITKPVSADMLRDRVQRLLEASHKERMVDELTSLDGPKRIKLELQKAINTKIGFSLAYAELLRVIEFGQRAGPEARSKALRHFARGLGKCGEDLGGSAFRLGHLGGGHFVCLVNPKHAEAYCKRVYKLWTRHRDTLYDEVGFRAHSGQEEGPNHVLDALFCVTTHPPTSALCAKDLFEILTRLRGNALAGAGHGVYIDRRR